MPRKANANKHLKPSTKRFYQFMIDSGKSRSDFASELGLSVSGLNNIFLRGNDISEVLARAAEQAFGVNHRWLLEGEEPPLVNHKSLLPSDIWLLKMASSRRPTPLTMKELPLALVSEYLREKLIEMQRSLLAKGLENHPVFQQVIDWTRGVTGRLRQDLQELQEDFPVKNEPQAFHGGISSGEISAEQMKQWETGRFFLMDVIISNQENSLTKEARAFGIEVHHEWIDKHWQRFRSQWEELEDQVKAALSEAENSIIGK